MVAVELGPVPAPLAVLPAFIAQHPTTLIMKESIFSLARAFTVKTMDGHDVLKIDTDTLSLSSRKRVFDPDNNHLFTLHKETFSIPKSFYAKSPAGAKIIEVEGKLHFGSSKAIGHFVNAENHEQEHLEMQRSFFGTKTHITNKKNGQVVAEIDRQRWNARQLIANHGTYAVTVAAGVDIALIVAMVIYLDETRQR